MDELQKLSQIMKEYRQTKTQKQYVFKQWATWNHWACRQPEYFLWASENGFKPSQLKAKRYHPEIKVVYEIDEGASLYALKGQYDLQLEKLRKARSQQLKLLWEHETQGAWTYSLDQIAKAYGETPNAVNRMITCQLWFKPRTEMSGKRWHPAKAKAND